MFMKETLDRKISGISLLTVWILILIAKKKSFFGKCYCATRCALCCTILCDVVTFAVQSYLRAYVTYCKYIAKHILWRYVHFQIFGIHLYLFPAVSIWKSMTCW